MSDIALEFRENNFDFVIDNGDIKIDGGIVTAVIMSLGINANVDGMAGWWGAVNDDAILGSRLHLIQSTSQSDQQLLLEYIKEALQWLISDGIARNVNVALINNTSSRINVIITITQPSGNTEVNIYWDATISSIGIK